MSDTRTRRYAVYALAANDSERHDLRFLGEIETDADDTMGGEMKFEKQVDELVERLTRDVPRLAGGPDQEPWDLLAAAFGAGGVDAYQAVVAWPSDSLRQVNRPDRRPFRLGWPGGKAMTVRSI
jgi:hypothetical protein